MRKGADTSANPLTRFVDHRWAATVARVAVGVVFLFSGLSKIQDIDGTVRTVRAYRLLPGSFAQPVGSGLPLLELLLAVLLLAGLLTRLTAAITLPLCTAFFIGVSSAWARGLRIHCGCFGNNGADLHPVPGYIRELILNMVIILVCGWLVARPISRWSLDSALGLSVDDPDHDTDLDDQTGLDDDQATTSIGAQE